MIPLNQNLAPLRRSGIRVFTNLARQTPGCVMLTIGEPDFATPEPIKAAALMDWGVSKSGSPMVNLMQPGVSFARLVNTRIGLRRRRVKF